MLLKALLFLTRSDTSLISLTWVPACLCPPPGPGHRVGDCGAGLGQGWNPGQRCAQGTAGCLWGWKCPLGKVGREPR